MAFFEDFAEVKRIYVRQAARGRGVAQALLARIEAEAHAGGFGQLKLECARRRHSFYERSGLQPCPAFDACATIAPQAIATSVFLQKLLRA